MEELMKQPNMYLPVHTSMLDIHTMTPYLDLKIKNTIQAIKDHKFSNILEDIGDSDITYNLNFNLYANYINQFEKLDHLITNQKKFLTSMEIG